MTIGKSFQRLEDPRLLVGKGQYVADLQAPGMLEAYVVRSLYAHAKIRGIDIQAASTNSGVVAIFTARDLPSSLPPIPMRQASSPELENALQMPLASDVVRYAGEPIAVIVARSRYAAEDASDTLQVDYEPLAAVTEISAAVRSNALLVHPLLGSNIVHTIVSQRGEPGTALQHAPHRLNLEFSVQRHAAVPLETRGLLAVPDVEGRLHVYGPTKVIHYNHTLLARMLQCDPALIHFVEPDVGGGFGARGEFYPEDFLIPYIAKRLGQPIRWVEDRLEHLRATNHSREQRHQLTVGFDDCGKLLALEDEIWVNTGAYIRTHGVTVPDLMQALLPGPYAWPAFKLVTHVVVSNKTPLGTYRSPGRFEGTFVRERMIEGVARVLHIDPTTVRERNFITPDQMPYATGTRGLGEEVIYDSGDYKRILAIARERMRWDTFPVRQAQARQRGCLLGCGWSFFVEKSGLGPWEDARVGLDAAGEFYCHSGLAALGQGTRTILAQIFADRIGVRLNQVKIVYGDTDIVPAGGGSFASRGTAVGGVAVYLAAEELRKRILTVAEHVLEVSASDLQLGPEGPFVVGSRQSIDWHLIAAHAGEMGLQLDLVERHEVSQMTYPYGVHAAEVSVDAGTGHVHIERYLIAYDVGRVVNPALVEGQLVGGMAQGLGGTLMEEFVYDDAGQLLSGTLMDYLLPGACEVPDIETIITEDAPSRCNPLGIKGAGEGGTTGVGAAIANAIADALDAPPEACTRLPLRPEAVLGWLRQASSHGNDQITGR